MCTNTPLVIADKGPWYRGAFERLVLEYKHERYSMRNRVERFFRYLKERTAVFQHKLSAGKHVQGGEQNCSIGHYSLSDSVQITGLYS
jgi:transposase-like protein